jgi:hypothetical protein
MVSCDASQANFVFSHLLLSFVVTASNRSAFGRCLGSQRRRLLFCSLQHLHAHSSWQLSYSLLSCFPALCRKAALTMRFPIYSLIFSTLVANSVVLAHSSSTNSHARRSLNKSNDLQKRQLNIGDLHNVGDFISEYPQLDDRYMDADPQDM